MKGHRYWGPYPEGPCGLCTQYWVLLKSTSKISALLSAQWPLPRQKSSCKLAETRNHCHPDCHLTQPCCWSSWYQWHPAHPAVSWHQCAVLMSTICHYPCQLCHKVSGLGGGGGGGKQVLIANHFMLIFNAENSVKWIIYIYIYIICREETLSQGGLCGTRFARIIFQSHLPHQSSPPQGRS